MLLFLQYLLDKTSSTNTHFSSQKWQKCMNWSPECHQALTIYDLVHFYGLHLNTNYIDIFTWSSKLGDFMQGIEMERIQNIITQKTNDREGP